MADRKLRPPVNGVEERLDLVLDELRGLRQDLQASKPRPANVSGQVELKEPAAPAAQQPNRGGTGSRKSKRGG